MPVFKLGAHVTVSAYTEVEAPSLEEAIAESAGREVVLGSLHNGSSVSEQWIIEDADGELTDIHGEMSR